MKVFFGTNLTLGKNNDRMDGEDFGVERLPQAQETALEENAARLDAIQQKAGLAAPMRALLNVCRVATVVLGYILVSILIEVPFARAYAVVPYLFWMAPIAAAGWGVLSYLTIQRKKAVESGEEAKNALKAADALMRACYDSLGVAADAVNMDVLCSQYCIRDGKAVNKATGLYTFINTELKVFVQNDALCLADISQKICVPLSSLQSIRRIEKSITFPTWNKKKGHREAPYDQYKISANGFGFSAKSYCALCIQSEAGEDYELYFPAYELPTVQKLTGLIPTE